MVLSANRLSALIRGIFCGLFTTVWFGFLFTGAVKIFRSNGGEKEVPFLPLLALGFFLVVGAIPLLVTMHSLRTALTADILVFDVPDGIITRRGGPLAKVGDVSQVMVQAVKGEDQHYYYVKIRLVSGVEHDVDSSSDKVQMVALALDIGELLEVEVVRDRTESERWEV
jgi:hypothetical protein